MECHRHTPRPSRPEDGVGSRRKSVAQRVNLELSPGAPELPRKGRATRPQGRGEPQATVWGGEVGARRMSRCSGTLDQRRGLLHSGRNHLPRALISASYQPEGQRFLSCSLG